MDVYCAHQICTTKQRIFLFCTKSGENALFVMYVYVMYMWLLVCDFETFFFFGDYRTTKAFEAQLQDGNKLGPHILDNTRDGILYAHAFFCSLSMISGRHVSSQWVQRKSSKAANKKSPTSKASSWVRLRVTSHGLYSCTAVCCMWHTFAHLHKSVRFDNCVLQLYKGAWQDQVLTLNKQTQSSLIHHMVCPKHDTVQIVWC